MEPGTPVWTGYDAPIRQSVLQKRLMLGVPYFVGFVGSVVTFFVIWQATWPQTWIWRLLFYVSVWTAVAGTLALLTRREPEWLTLFWRRLFERDLLE